MSQFAPGSQPQNRVAQSIGFLLLDNFTLISLASAVEPLRMANQLSGKELYRWHTLTHDGQPVSASDGLKITPDAALDNAPALDAVIRHKLQVLGVANGQRVPEDWHRLSSHALVQKALRVAGGSAYRMDSSDVNLVFAAPQAHLTAQGGQRAGLHHA